MPTQIYFFMIVSIIIAIILWFVAPLLIDGHVKRKSDKKAYKLLCKILAVTIILFIFLRILNA